MEIIDFHPQELQKLQLILPHSHKGANGKVLVIGGSELFHSASIWAAELLAHFVDLVFYYSPALINQKIMFEVKSKFRDGIVIAEKDLSNYLTEADVVLIGPGMERNSFTKKFSNDLLKEYPAKKWVIDAGALQELELNNCQPDFIYTPHSGEVKRLFPQFPEITNLKIEELMTTISETTKGAWLLKINGVDYIFSTSEPKVIKVTGGNEGLTKGGSGDLLAALTAAFYVKNEAVLAATCASYVLKKTAEALYKKRGPFFSTSELLATIPEVFWQVLKSET